jgi:hypothetical protein
MMKYSRIIACCLLISMFTCSFASAEVLNKPAELASSNANETQILTVSVSANPDTVESGQTSKVTVHVESGGKPVEGASVRIFAGGGFYDKITGITDANGAVVFKFTAMLVTTQTKYTITADATKEGYDSASGTGTVNVQPPLPPDQTLTVSVSANPTSVLSGQTSQVKVHIDWGGKARRWSQHPDIIRWRKSGQGDRNYRRQRRSYTDVHGSQHHGADPVYSDSKCDQGRVQ